jgi:hypothetical protein
MHGVKTAPDLCLPIGGLLSAKQINQCIKFSLKERGKMQQRRHENTRLRSCKDFSFPIVSTDNDENCLQVLSEYDNVTFLDRWLFGVESVLIGAGAHGVALKVYYQRDRSTPLFIKIMPRLTPAETEIKKACEVDEKLAQKLSAFSRIYGWIACTGSQMSDRWKAEIQRYSAYKREAELQRHAAAMEKARLHLRAAEKMAIERDTHQENMAELTAFNPLKDPCYFLVGEYANGLDLNRVAFTSEEECKRFLFEVIYALYVGHKDHGYFHHDLHMGNVIASLNTGPVLRNYTVNGNIYTIISDMRPVIIDYGLSTFDIEESAYEWGRTVSKTIFKNPTRMIDAYLLWLFAHNEEFRHHLLRDVDKLLMSMEMKSPSPANVKDWISRLRDALPMHNFESLLGSEWFASLKTGIASMGTEIPAPTCHVCGHVASQQYEHAPSFKFCDGTACAAHMGPIGHLLN